MQTPDTPRPRPGPPADDESALLDRLRAGDDAAYEAVVRRHAGPMLAVARRFLGSRPEAEDAVQEAFLAAFRSLDGFREGSRLATWLHRVTVNVALMRLRRLRRRPEEPADESLDGLLPAFDATGHSLRPPREWQAPAQRLLEQKETRARVRDGIQRLPAGYRAVLLLRDIEERDTGETARLLDLTPGAVKVRLHRARLALRGLLAGEYEKKEEAP
jgi:RNA polymerase sigma-70 factor (ECF subfamily)